MIIPDHKNSDGIRQSPKVARAVEVRCRRTFEPMAALARRPVNRFLAAAAAAISTVMASCSITKPPDKKEHAGTATGEVSVVAVDVVQKTLRRTVTLSSELVPFQQIDVYAKESGYLRELRVDYGTRVRRGQLMAVLDIPEQALRLQEDEAAIQAASREVAIAEHAVNRYRAEHQAAHLQHERLRGVAEAKPTLVAQQQVDDAQGRDLVLEAEVEAAKAAAAAARNQLAEAEAQLARDRAVFAYSRITAPFDGVVTKRYANLGTLMQAGTSTNSEVIPLVRLAQMDVFRVTIPVPEMHVQFVRLGDPVTVRVPSLGRSMRGQISRFSARVSQDTRTMHTEVDVPNPDGVLLPGAYAEATLVLEEKTNILVIPLEAVDHPDTEPVVGVVNGAGRIEIRPVTLGARSLDSVEVLSGLSERDRVAVGAWSDRKRGWTVMH